MTIVTIKDGDAVMSSADLRDLINEARVDAGEPKIRNDQFITKVEDELAGELGDCKKIAHPQSGVLMDCYDLTRDQCMLVSMRESKAVRRRVTAKLNNLERHAHAPALPGDYISALEHLLESKRSEQLAIEQRDHAIETKAEIGSRREATAMATASAAVRQAQKLKDDLGLGTRQAAILAVEKALGRKFGVSGYVPLRRWCKERDITAPKVFHPTYGFVRCWPAGAWIEVYQIDLADLFGAEGEQA
ncbi:hypothetical protein I6U33_05415 [Pseudomonas carnis]|uniref:hypothetical protein n=1 Tax=Pseudomonas TaxID=286 RepID=UPI0018E7D756|nr:MULTISPECIES: hypothetical protein [Pseudomonas]MBJ2225739.1 hypothetical protein [Pseudomonas sp. MF7451]MBW9236760.1 hypothetical protein [Pseudomonas carnis]